MTFLKPQAPSTNSPPPPLNSITSTSASSLTVAASPETTKTLQEEQQSPNTPPVSSKLTTTLESAMPFSDVTASNNATCATEGNRLTDVGLETGQIETRSGTTSMGLSMPLSLLAAKGVVGPNGLLSKNITHFSSSPTPGSSPLVTPAANGNDIRPASYFSENSTTSSEPGAKMVSNGDVPTSSLSNSVSGDAGLDEELAPSGTKSSTLEGLGKVSRELRDQVQEFLDTKFEDPSMERVKNRVRDSMGIMAEALQKYRMPTLSLSFNGGKDCLLLLVLLLASLPQPTIHPLQTIYVPPSDPFPEVTTFVRDCVKTYHLHLVSYPLPMRPAFSAYIEEHPWIKAIFVGTRRTDPHGGTMHAFEETDGNWARFTRINPVLEWEYDEVWKFLNWGKWKICELYEHGYTSLGGVGDTVENPALRVTEEDGRVWYKPAWDLEDGTLERAGRGRSKK